MRPVREYVKKLILPDGFDPPRRLSYEDVVATVLGRADLDDDVRGINASLDLIRRTRGGQWPEEAVTTDFNFVDLVWHECEFREGDSFLYVLRDADGGYLGCAYLYPLGRRASSPSRSPTTTSTSAGGSRPTPTRRATTSVPTTACAG